jgi:hypothetical protein|tara:strand:- start:312 stop:758 length:447 start_codon:yes stop_codon:yes gene_type:complete
MKKRKLLFYFVLLIGIQFSTKKVSAQLIGTNNLPGVLPASPSASEFLKYGEVPVSKYTGVPNISIPIYSIQAKGLTIPINLSYHSNGFKVNEEAGWTGLGWSLNTGGSIVQIVNSFDDFGPYKNRIFPDIDEVADVASNGGSVLNRRF